ncbi:uncharacterized protein [Rutidosis leptorrhynchoides]|uniref:uncharacterized protein n=1 Tax=Rutidosis leptorrhynchoides TaxID=125765 RepID=UPI003A9A49A8
MDESWRMRMGTTKQQNNLHPRRSTEDKTRQNYETLDPEDFDDVFGGPPQSVLSRQYSVEGDYARSTNTSMLFDDIFRKQVTDRDRTLPEFRIPVSETAGGRRKTDDEFYSDIFGNDRMSTSRSKSNTNSNSNSKSKSNSSSILSSEDFSPFRSTVVDDDSVSISSFASKLRPINVSSKWKTSEKMHETGDKQLNSPWNTHTFESEYIHKRKGCNSGFSKKVSSPEIIDFCHSLYRSVQESMEGLQVNSPASVVSSINHEQQEATASHEQQQEEEDEDLSSYVIEINLGSRERIDESVGVDDAIAWAKQKYQTHNSEKSWTQNLEENKGDVAEEIFGANKFPEVPIVRRGSRESNSLEKQDECTTGEQLQKLENDLSPCKQMELELLDEDIKLWSDGKEPNIRLLLSTLHHILWPSSGWIMMPLTSLKDSSNVKKAYQKARLCLHPDKLQQRGATLSQKYVAEKAFPILQDAWAAFISEDVRSSIT